MQYEQSRDRSADLLRQAVGYMGRQESGFDPASYTLWYEHAAGINPALSQVLEQRLTAQIPLTSADVSRLYAKHIAAREAQSIERIQRRLFELMSETSQVIADSGVHAAGFGQSLDSHSKRLSGPVPESSVQSVIDDLLRETQQMVRVNSMLSKQLDTRAQEVQQLSARLAQVEAEALIDSLTGLANRRGFEEAARDVVGLKGTALLLADVDEFKKINDSFGHHTGDQVLRGVAQVIRSRIKGADVAARLGGDEFAILLPETSLAGAVTLAEQIRSTLAKSSLKRVQADERLATVSVSIGVAHGGEGTRLEPLMKDADGALYAAKRQGRNRVCSAGSGPSGGSAGSGGSGPSG